MLIFCEKKSPRLDYVLKIVFQYLLKTAYRITSDETEFNASVEPKINYSTINLGGGIQINPSEILFETGFRKQEISNTLYNGHTVLFSGHSHSSLPYDVFAAIFYMVSRYEEYLPFKPDKHGRFPLELSLAYKLKMHERPVVHYWAMDLMSRLKSDYPTLDISLPQFKFQPTFDIDNAYAFRHKSMIRTSGSFFKSLFTNPISLFYRLKVLLSFETDPYDNYDYIESVNLTYGTRPHYFILTSSDGNFDRNIHPRSKAFRKLVTRLNKNGEIGLHPSYASNKNPGLLKKEMELLTEITDKKINSGRQHFLMLKFPETYENLEKAGITSDYSMAFPERPGFRAGITIPFPFFNLKQNRESSLMIYPASFMESSFVYYGNNNQEKVLEDLSDLIHEIRQVHGTFIPIWHNESLSERGKWKGWRRIFETMYHLAAKN